MRLYFAGSFSSPGNNHAQFLRDLGIKNKLYSYFNDRKAAEEWGHSGQMLDSGAFSAWTRKAVIDIDELIAFIHKVNPERAIQLDVIGDSDATWENYLYMKFKANVMPVIHLNAPDYHIERVLNDDAIYICLGGLVGTPTQKQIKWLDHVFSFPKIRVKRVHILGVMTNAILLRYPAYSADSSSALSGVRYPVDPRNEYMFWKQKTQHYTRLYEDFIHMQKEQEKLLTSIWKRRGISWDD